MEITSTIERILKLRNFNRPVLSDADKELIKEKLLDVVTARAYNKAANLLFGRFKVLNEVK